MRTWRTPVLAVLFVMVGAACASTGAGAGDGMSYDRISAEEIAEMQGKVNNLYDLVDRLRPRWLTTRVQQRSFTGGDQQIVVFQEQSLLGGVERLRDLGLDFAQSLQYLDEAQATGQLPGLGSRRIEGAIVIHTR